MLGMNVDKGKQEISTIFWVMPRKPKGPNSGHQSFS